MQDPQSLHKYAYVHGDPVQGIDPTGEWTSVSVVVSMAVINTAIAAYFVGIPAVERSYDQLEKSTAVGRGGRDITRQMKLLNKHFVQAWNLQHISAKEDIMEVNGDLHDWSQVSTTNPFGLNVQGVGSRDAAQLGSPLMQQDFSVGADWIPRSVTVDGKAYLAHEVNYYYYGYLNGLAWKENHGLGKDVSAVKSNITLYRPAGYVFFNARERREFDEAWLAGWHGQKRGGNLLFVTNF